MLLTQVHVDFAMMWFFNPCFRKWSILSDIVFLIIVYNGFNPQNTVWQRKREEQTQDGLGAEH